MRTARLYINRVAAMGALVAGLGCGATVVDDVAPAVQGVAGHYPVGINYDGGPKLNVAIHDSPDAALAPEERLAKGAEIAQAAWEACPCRADLRLVTISFWRTSGRLGSPGRSHNSPRPSERPWSSSTGRD